MTDAFWNAVEAQLVELETAATADDVLRILSQERNPYGPGSSSADGFFAGSGGDGSVMGSLEKAGWSVTWSEASYYWVMEAPNGDKIRYVEGDIYRGDRTVTE
ncbi:hypothetical protein AB0P21_09655 [Kribbella sp. NPDC056861]|uniref:hypothetical protein n=1 Tax=Kribbella sp. NPDC056861 TaxID=3154857 RepID=UPI003423E8C1